MSDLVIAQTGGRRADGTAEERTGWRDQWISARHREWGRNVPAVDIDFLMIEYDRAIPRALIEYKAHPAPYDAHSANMTAMARLANAAGIPLFVVLYRRDSATFLVRGINAMGRQHDLPEWLSEAEYVEFLYQLRGRAKERAA